MLTLLLLWAIGFVIAWAVMAGASVVSNGDDR